MMKIFQLVYAGDIIILSGLKEEINNIRTVLLSPNGNNNVKVSILYNLYIYNDNISCKHPRMPIKSHINLFEKLILPIK